MKKELLETLIEQNLSSYQISKETGKSQTTVRYWLKKYNIKTNHQNFVNQIKVEQTNKKCPQCKTTKPIGDFYFRRDKTSCSPYCKICTNTQAIARQRNLKQLCVEYKGGKCSICQYDKYIGALEFHHLDPTQKEFSISNAKKWTFNDRIKTELDKCILLCSNCHREVHSIM